MEFDDNVKLKNVKDFLAGRTCEKQTTIEKQLQNPESKISQFIERRRAVAQAVGIGQVNWSAYQVAEAFNEQGKKLVSGGQYDEAITAFGEAIERDGNEFIFFVNRSIACFYAGDFKGAVKDATTAIEMVVDHPVPYRIRGTAHAFRKHYRNAIDDFNCALDLDAGDSIALKNRALAYAYLKRYDCALADATLAVEHAVTDAEAQSIRGMVNLKLDRAQEAIVDCSRAIELSAKRRAKDYSACVNRGVAYFRTGDVDAAIRDFRKAIRCREDDSTAWINLGFCLHHKQKFKEAIQKLSEALDEIESDDTSREELLSIRAIAYTHDGNCESALRDCDELYRLNPDSKTIAYVHEHCDTNDEFLSTEAEEAQLDLTVHVAERPVPLPSFDESLSPTLQP